MLKKVLLGSAIVILATVLFIFYRVHSHLNEMAIDTDNVIVPQSTEPPEKDNAPRIQTEDRDTQTTNKPQKETEDFYTLLIGLDTRGKEFTLNTDSLIVAHIIPQNKTAKLVSIPRDTRVRNPMPGHAADSDSEYAKINAVFAEGYMQALRASQQDASLLSGKKVKLGANKIPEEFISSGIAQLRNTINDYFDIDIRYSYLIDFQTVVSLVDAVHGITVDVERNMDWDDEFDGTHIHLEKGVQKLDGQRALDYARFRRDNHGPEYDSSDLQRGLRQQKVIQALIDKLTGWGSVTKALNLLDIVTSNVKTDMPQSVMASLVQKYYGHLDEQSIESLDFNGYWESPYIYINDDDLDELKTNLASLDAAPAASLSTDTRSATGSVNVSSVGADSAQARSVSADSAQAGSVNADSAQDGSVDADSAQAGSVDADSVQARSVSGDSAQAGSVDAGPADTDAAGGFAHTDADIDVGSSHAGADAGGDSADAPSAASASVGADESRAG